MSSKEKVAHDVSDLEQRHLLIAAQIRNGLPIQLRAMREDRGWTQAALAEKLGTTQNTVSRLENPKTSKPTITTLKRIAEAFDVSLIVKFAPFTEFIDSVAGMSRKSVAVPSYEKELEEDQESEVEAQLKSLEPTLSLMFSQAEQVGVDFGGMSADYLYGEAPFPSLYPSRAAAANKMPVATQSGVQPHHLAIKREKEARVVSIEKGRKSAPSGEYATQITISAIA